MGVGVFGAMISSVTGLVAQSQALGIISDNISNVNTFGYKTARSNFSTLVTDISATSYSPGGVRSVPFTEIDRQGLLQASTSVTDLAVQGNGFFAVSSSPAAGQGELLYTRAGGFAFDQNGDLANVAGFYLQGWSIVNGVQQGSSVSQLQTINLTNMQVAARATQNISIAANLDASAAIAGTFTTDVTVTDSLGADHLARITWTKAAANQWTPTVSSPTGTIGTIGIAGGPVNFNPANGTLASPASLTLTTSNFNSGATAPATVTVNLGTPGSADGMTQFAGFFDISSVTNDGLSTGTLAGLAIDKQGLVKALFSNGQELDIYRVPLITFTNPNGLEVRDGNAYSATDRSGSATPHNPQTGGAGSINSSTLETSTTDLGTEFTNMIVTQRAYSAATRAITTADEMLEDLLRIIR
jgi:flagellar hook protein FlgE